MLYLFQDNEKTRDVIIDHRFHKAIIGAQGANIRDIREKFNNVVILFPDQSKQSDVVSMRGRKHDVDQCYKYLQGIAQDMVIFVRTNKLYYIWRLQVVCSLLAVSLTEVLLSCQHCC